MSNVVHMPVPMEKWTSIDMLKDCIQAIEKGEFDPESLVVIGFHKLPGGRKKILSWHWHAWFDQQLAMLAVYKKIILDRWSA